MAWYVSLQATTGRNRGRRLLVAGPYDTAGQARRAEPIAMRLVDQLGFDPTDAPWFNWGIAHSRTGRPKAHPAIASRVPCPAGLP